MRKDMFQTRRKQSQNRTDKEIISRIYEEGIKILKKAQTIPQKDGHKT